ncbi:DUF4352 domain-containing protein [Rhodococcus sp. 11-3]|uniref:DUF4352 domain-containing protein n=1 Tax=Rhodococcus sp. 11-3 TaxID=2854796 RepID=UPI00204078A1|nr:DUF4352 domain-containing protein [Rhodococcus sp. 11-3]USC16243.1 DUF4352 domain-containing protein [Rhodococcus sp. 11-3]
MTQPPQQPYGQQPHPGPQSQPQWGAQQPAQPPKKSRKWPWILGAVVALFVVIGLASGGDEDKPTSTTGSNSSNSDSASGGSPATAEQAADEPTAGIGTEARDGKFAFTVTNVEQGITQAGENPYVNKIPQGQFIFVHIDVKNISDKPQGYFGSNQKLIDTQGREFNNDTAAEIYANENFTVGDINPGNTASVIVVFDVPVDAQPKSVELHDSMFSGGVTVNIS